MLQQEVAQKLVETAFTLLKAAAILTWRRPKDSESSQCLNTTLHTITMNTPNFNIGIKFEIPIILMIRNNSGCISEWV